MSDRLALKDHQVVDPVVIAEMFRHVLTRVVREVAITLPPRLLNADEAAAYTGRSLNTFLRGVATGEWPAPIPECRDLRLWDRHELDEYIDRRRGKPSIAADEHALDRKFGT